MRYQRKAHGDRLKIFNVNSYSSFSFLRLVFWKSIHLEVASGPFCLLVNSPWLLVFALCVFFLSLSGFNLYCWRGIHFSWSNFLIFLYLFSSLLFSFHFWFRDLLRELDKKYEVLLMVFFLSSYVFLSLSVFFARVFSRGSYRKMQFIKKYNIPKRIGLVLCCILVEGALRHNLLSKRGNLAWSFLEFILAHDRRLVKKICYAHNLWRLKSYLF